MPWGMDGKHCWDCQAIRVKLVDISAVQRLALGPAIQVHHSLKRLFALISIVFIGFGLDVLSII